MTVQVPADEIEKAVEERLRSMSGRVKVDGFRPGKVPFKVVKSKYGAQVRGEVVDEAVRNSFSRAVSEQELRLAGAPYVEARPVEPGQPLEYVAVFEVYPQIELAPLAGVRIERPVVEIAEQDLDGMLEKLRTQRTEWIDVERAAQDGDRVMIDFEGSVDGEVFPGGSGKQVAVVLGSNSMIPGFEEGLLGAQAGEERSLDVTFPEGYQAQELAGKPAVFKVTVHSVAEPKLPELDEAFATSFGISEGGIETLRGEVRENMRRELEQKIKGAVKERVLEVLLDKNQVEVPKGLVEQEVQRLMQQSGLQMPQNVKDPEVVNSLFEPQARRRVSLSLILAEIANDNQIELDQARVRATVENVAKTYDNPDEFVKWYYQNREALAHVESLVLEEQVVDWVLEQVEVDDVTKTFDEMMNPQEQSGQD